MTNNHTKIAFLVNNLSFFYSHRFEIAQEAIKKGYQVWLLGPVDSSKENHSKYGFFFHHVPVQPKVRFFGDIKSFFSIYFALRKIKPDLVHLVTVRPWFFGGIISRLLKINSVVYAISGLGHLFLSRSLITKILRFVVFPFFKYALNHPHSKVIFQNKDDQDLFLKKKWVKLEKTKIIEGSGVNLNRFVVKDFPKKKQIVMASRLIHEKGVLEYIEAARKIKQNKKWEFLLAGEQDDGNPSCVKKKELDQWEREGVIHWVGNVSLIEDLFSSSSIVVLPSYREGLPKVLIEAAACGRPIVTTDVPGCRSVVYNGKNGILVPVKNPNALSEAILKIGNDSELMKDMGYQGRKIAEDKFSVEIVVSKTMDIYTNLLSTCSNINRCT